jgi:hypothetical protein
MGKKRKTPTIDSLSINTNRPLNMDAVQQANFDGSVRGPHKPLIFLFPCE